MATLTLVLQAPAARGGESFGDGDPDPGASGSRTATSARDAPSRLADGQSSSREDVAAGFQHVGVSDAENAFHGALDTREEQAAVAVDVRPEDPVPRPVGVPGSGKVTRGEDGDAGGPDRGREVHGSAVVAEVEKAALKGRRR